MHDRDRLRQIRVLRERLERLPASAERDWMLGEVGRRAVDVESGLRAAPMRPLVEEVEAEEPERPPSTAPRTRARTRAHAVSAREASATSVARAAAAAAATAPATPLQEGLMLCLDDDVVVVAEPGRHRPTSPWARGLRG